MKKIISLFSVCAVLASFCFNVSAATEEPKLTLSATTTGYSKGDVVTVTCNYSGLNVTPYDDNEGAGQKTTGVQVSINIPGGIGTAATTKQFLRPGVTNTTGFSTGAPQYNWSIPNGTFTAAISGIDDPTTPEGKVFEISMKLNQDITSDLVFSFVDTYEQNLVYDNYADWTMGDTIQNKFKGDNLVSYTLKAPVSKVDVTGVSIKDKADFTLDLNGETTRTLTATVAPTDATNTEVTWSSDNEKAATVVDGKVTAVGEGEAKITVTTVDGGFTDSVKVTVKDTTPPEKPIVDVTPSKITGDYGTKTLKYIAKIVKNADATACIKVTKTLNGKTESKETTQTIAELLGGVATEGTLVSADVAIGVLTADTDAVFSFGLVK